MTSRETHEARERRVLELLPWYINGTLEGDERELVKRQVLASLTCRKELERQRRLQELIRREDAEAFVADRAFERLMARIKASDSTSRAHQRRAGGATTWNRFAAAAALVAAVSALWWRADTTDVAPATYETMSRPQPADSRSATVRVMFAPTVTDSERQQLLASHGLKAVGPPDADGVVILSFNDATDQADALAALKQDPRILLVTTPPGTGAP
jgi:hypothetical protein